MKPGMSADREKIAFDRVECECKNYFGGAFAFALTSQTGPNHFRFIQQGEVRCHTFLAGADIDVQKRQPCKAAAYLGRTIFAHYMFGYKYIRLVLRRPQCQYILT